jgi:hypothetical protein
VIDDHRVSSVDGGKGFLSASVSGGELRLKAINESGESACIEGGPYGCGTSLVIESVDAVVTFVDGNVLAPPAGFDDINMGALNVREGLDVQKDLLVDRIQLAGKGVVVGEDGILRAQ